MYYRQPAPDASGWSLSRLGTPLLTTTLLLLLCMIPLRLIFGFITATGLTRRLRRLTQASNGLAGGDLSRRVHGSSGDEIGQRARQFNAMAGQLEADTTQLRELADRNARLARQAQTLAALEDQCKVLRPQGFKPDNPPHLCEGITREAVVFSIDFVSERLRRES